MLCPVSNRNFKSNLSHHRTLHFTSVYPKYVLVHWSCQLFWMSFIYISFTFIEIKLCYVKDTMKSFHCKRLWEFLLNQWCMAITYALYGGVSFMQCSVAHDSQTFSVLCMLLALPTENYMDSWIYFDDIKQTITSQNLFQFSGNKQQKTSNRRGVTLYFFYVFVVNPRPSH